jgi:hypothetical protein
MRRYSGALPAAPPPGSPLVTADGAPAGEVVMASGTDGAIEILAVVEHASAGAPLHVGAASGARLTEQPLPYDVPPR